MIGRRKTDKIKTSFFKLRNKASNEASSLSDLSHLPGSSERQDDHQDLKQATLNSSATKSSSVISRWDGTDPELDKHATSNSKTKKKEFLDPFQNEPGDETLWDYQSVKYLVAEQPGWNVGISGIIFALFLGLIFRALFNPDRIREHIEKAASQIHENIQLNFKGAHISLADGIFPELAVVVEDIRMSSNEACWMRPLIEVDKIKLPLSFSQLIQGKVIIDQIVLNETNLSLNEWPIADCRGRSPASESGNDQTPRVSPNELNHLKNMKTQTENSKVGGQKIPRGISSEGGGPRDNKFDLQILKVNPKNIIRLIEIKKLNVHFMPIEFTSLYFDDLKLILSGHGPLVATLEGDVLLSRDSNIHYPGGTHLLVSYHEDGPKRLQATLQGGVAEGSFQLVADAEFEKNQFQLSGDVRYFPLSQILPVLKKYRWIQSDFTGKRTWVSGQFAYQGTLAAFKQGPYRFTDLKVEGDLGEVSSASIDVESFQPLKLKPHEIILSRLSLAELRKIWGFEKISPIFGNLGEFNGVLNIESPQRVFLRGDLLGLEFIFSNRGIRKNQIISLISGELELKEKNWKAKIDRIQPHDGAFDGDLRFESDKEWSQLKFDSRVRDLQLSPMIQNLMTGGGKLGPASGDLSFYFSKNKIVDLKGNIKLKDVLVDGVLAEDLKLQILQKKNDKQNSMYDAFLQSTLVEIPKNALAAANLRIIFDETKLETMILKNAKTHLETQDFKSLSWNDLQGDSEWGKWISSGGWDQKSKIEGQIQLKNRKELREWRILGNRNSVYLESHNKGLPSLREMTPNDHSSENLITDRVKKLFGRGTDEKREAKASSKKNESERQEQIGEEESKNNEPVTPPELSASSSPSSEKKGEEGPSPAPAPEKKTNEK